MLNDLSRPIRVFLFSIGLIAASPFAILISTQTEGRAPVPPLMMILPGNLLFCVVAIWYVLSYTSADKRLIREIEVGSREITGGEVTPLQVVGRIIRSRRRSAPGFVMSSRESWSPARAYVVSMFGDGKPRRVAMLVPSTIRLTNKTPVALALHPGRPEIAVLEDRVDAEQIAQIDADLHRRTEQPPSDWAIAGGWVTLCFLPAGVLAGLGLWWLIVVAFL